MTREEAKDNIKRMYKGNPTPIQLKALEIAYAALQEPERKHGYWFKGEQLFPVCPNCGTILDGEKPIKDEQENQEKA